MQPDEQSSTGELITLSQIMDVNLQILLHFYCGMLLASAAFHLFKKRKHRQAMKQ